MTIEAFNALEEGDLIYRVVCWNDNDIVQVDSVAYVKGKGRRRDGVEVCNGTKWSEGNWCFYAHDIDKWHTSNGLEAAMIDFAEKVLAHKIQKYRNQIAASQLKLDDLLTKQPSDIIQLSESHKEKRK